MKIATLATRIVLGLVLFAAGPTGFFLISNLRTSFAPLLPART